MGQRAGSSLRFLPALTVGLFLGPVIAGLVGTLLPAFGYLPTLGGAQFSLEPWRRLLAAPGLFSALQVTLTTGFASTALALALTILVFAAGHGTAALARIRRGMVPLLAVPHLALAVGLAFLIAPSGWLVRLIAPWPTGWHTPPDVALVQDPLGLALAFGLVLKETPFLLLMTFAAVGQVRADPQLRMARALGYGPVQAWLKVVLPQVYPQIRLPVYAVLAYALSVVDMAIVLGPTTPPTFAVLLFRWFEAPDLTMRFQAAAGAVLQFGIVVLGIALWRALEAFVGWLAGPGWSMAAAAARAAPRASPRGLASRSCSGVRSAVWSASRCGRSRAAGAFRTRCRSRGRWLAGRTSWPRSQSRPGRRSPSASRRPASPSCSSRAASRTRAAAGSSPARAPSPCSTCLS